MDEGENELSMSHSCNCDQVLITTPEDFSLSTKLSLQSVKGEPGVFNIGSNDRTCRNKIISVKEDCDVDLVELWYKDDFSGRQRFLAEPVEGEEGVFTFKVGGRPGCKSVYLTTEPVNGTLILSREKDTKFQKFRVDLWLQYAPTPVYFSATSYLKFQRTAGEWLNIGMRWHKCLSHPLVQEAGTEDFLPVWKVDKVEGLNNVFRIIA